MKLYLEDWDNNHPDILYYSLDVNGDPTIDCEGWKELTLQEVKNITQDLLKMINKMEN